jgi:hypothetical protein
MELAVAATHFRRLLDVVMGQGFGSLKPGEIELRPAPSNTCSMMAASCQSGLVWLMPNGEQLVPGARPDGEH